MCVRRAGRPGGPSTTTTSRRQLGGGGFGSGLLLFQDLVELVGVLGGFDPDQEGDGGGGVLVVDGRVRHADHHHIVLPHPRARHGRRHDDVQQDVS